MKFYGTPNMSVFEINKSRKDAHNIYKRRKRLFSFDSNGEFYTDDAKLIERLKPKFRYEESKIENKEIEIKSEIKLRHCRKCDFTCENQGELMKHYREEHPKDGE